MNNLNPVIKDTNSIKENLKMANGTATANGSKNELACLVFISFLGTMKEILDFGEFKFGKGSDDYKYFKKQVMQVFYDKFRYLFKILRSKGLVQDCECKADVKQGYSECDSCHGSGYKNTDKLNNLLKGGS